ncbi:MAG: FUSC family protein [Vulcanimicrobiaceae bacterium]
MTAGVAIALLVPLALGHVAFGFPAAFGAIAAGFASQQGVYRTRAAAMLLTASAMAFSTFVGSLAGHSLAALVVTTALWGYGYGIIASLGPAATTVGINSVIAVVIYGHYPATPPEALLQGVLVLAGGIVQTFLIVMVWPLRRFTAERISLARAARSLAAYARDVARGQPGLPISAPLTTVRQTLADPQPFARRGDIAVFQALVDELERIRNGLGALATDRLVAARTRGIDEFALGAAGILEEIAAALLAAKEPLDSGNEWLRLRAAEDRLENLDETGDHVRSEVHAIAGQLRSAWRLATLPADVPIPSQPRSTRSLSLPRALDTIATLRANLTQRSPYGRLAPRLAGTLAIATILGGVLPTEHGYWIPMTAVILLRPDFSQTALRGIARVGGTLIGAAFATAITAHVRPGAETYVALTIFFAGVGYFVFKANYGLFTVAITAYVAFALALLGQTPTAALRDRILGTVVAGILSGIAVFVWPTWESGRARAALADLLDAQRMYLDAVLRAYLDPARYDPAAIADAQRTAWGLRANAEASIDRMLGEPGRTHAIEPRCALGILAATRRVGLASLSLNGHYPHAARIPRPGLEPFARALDAALFFTVKLLHEETPAEEYPHLRESYRAAQKALESAQDPNAEMILSIGDTLVDAVNTASELATQDRA